MSVGGKTSSAALPDGLGVRLPTPLQPAGAIRRTRLISMPVARNTGNANGNHEGPALFRIRTPSARLIASLTVGFRPDNAEDTALSAPFSGWTISADQWTQMEDSRWVKGNHIRNLTVSPATDTFPVPWSYSWADMAGELRLELEIPNASGLPEDGDIVAIARWEPAPGQVFDDQELYTLLSACNLQAERTIAVFEHEDE
jgi:hypothetical protein